MTAPRPGPVADPESPFAAFGLSGRPGTEAFWAKARTPASVPVDGGWLTLFLWRGSGAVLDFESWSPPVPLRRWEDTDCWYAEVPMPARLRVTYRVLVGDAAHADPFNPAGAGADRSLAATPDAPPQPYWPDLAADDVPPLPRTRIRWSSDRLGGRRTVRVHPVAGGGPVVLLLDGDDWLYLHPAVAAFDAAAAAGAMPPVTLVFVPAKDREAEFACRPGLWEAVRDELLPLVGACGVPADLDRMVVAGQSLGGLSALYAALEFPELVSRIACQSGSFWWAPGAVDLPDPLGGAVGGAIAERLRRGADLSRLRCAFDVGEHETRMLPHCELAESLTERAGATVRVSRSASDHDRAGWRHALVRDVAWALG
ncbi:alpha/beta hydrolase-fold protein [Streptomyces sp. ATCC51928]|uniref:Alpha/beta hydrolase-fold protein n=1 Tax=Streptomyces caviscabies TaxID=90079 RepID=A0ABW2MLS7_9ACTN|nr:MULTISPECIES: alpha/beta hydrolase-fold protein [unclassified Streptomyces]MDX3503932.1 alpha/beta hydrolase-fold protein [Streptomyces sp. ATCC51928]MDX5524759.1 alpha/beta hydrolase-fold protein [Streptomyces sp. DE06-01C]